MHVWGACGMCVCVSGPRDMYKATLDLHALRGNPARFFLYHRTRRIECAGVQRARLMLCFVVVVVQSKSRERVRLLSLRRGESDLIFH